MAKYVVYQTMRNSDMTEGRGAMVPDLCFSSRALAAEYIDQQPGVMGRVAKWSQDNFGDWMIVAIEVLNTVPSSEEKIRRKALSKLTAEEKRVLGL